MTDCSVKESLRLIEDLKFFLATAPANWQENQVIRRYYLNHDEGFVSCVFWNNLYFITGTDIVRCIVYKFEHFGRKIVDRKKFEEGIFSDLRNLKCGTDAILEPPRSEFLEFLFKNLCLRTQKKQKVFFWFNVPHDKLMADALERDLKKEQINQKPTTIAYREPASSFKFDESSALFAQLVDHLDRQQTFNKIKEEEDENNDEELSGTHKDIPSQNQQLNDIHSHSNGNDEQEDDKYDFLTQESPAQYKDSGYEDDFPLDYFDGQGVGVGNEYFNVDVGFAGVAGQVEEQYDAYIDPSIFSGPTASNPLVFNDEYLIEQAQPLKSAKYPPSLAALASSRLASKDDYFPSSQPPLSAKYQQTFYRGPGTAQGFPPPQQFWNDPQNSQQYFSEQQQQQMQQYGHQHMEFSGGGGGEYWQNEQQGFPQYFPPGAQSGNYYVENDEGYGQGSMMYQPNSSVIVHQPPPQFGRPYGMNNNMILKKRPLSQQQGSQLQTQVLRNPNKRQNQSYGNLDDIVDNKATRVVSTGNGTKTDSFPTPESSIVQSDNSNKTE